MEAAESPAEQRLKADDSKAVKLNASVVQYNEVTPENAASFHFHGEIGNNPITSIIVIPNDAKSRAIVKGRYAANETLQLISPEEEMDELFATVFSVQQLVLWLLGVVGAATLLIVDWYFYCPIV